MSNGDIVPVTGPDGKLYHFPSGTTKDSAIAYFKKKGIGAASSPAPSAEPPQPRKAEQAAPRPTAGQSFDISAGNVMDSIQRWRPRWDDPKTLLQDPHWYGRSAKFFGGEAIGAGKAGAGVLVGGAKMLSDLISSVDPVELYKRPPGEPGAAFTKDVVDVGKGILDVGKAAYDLVRHFPESSSDPESLGSTVTNIAMTVDGGLKGTKAIAEHLGFTPADAISTAHKVSKGTVDGLFRQKAVEDAYVHKNGVGIAKDITTAVSEAEKEVAVHTANLAQIDKNVPAGVVDASKEADVIKNAFSEVVKTPDPMNRALNEMVQDAKNTAPGQWTFEKTRQFRSKLGRAMNSIEGPQYAVASKIYGDLTGKLKGAAKKYGLEDSWNQYNELERKIHKSFGVIDAAQTIIDENGEGAKMASALKDKAVVKEVIDSLKKYGLDGKKVLDYGKRANKLISERGNGFKRIFQYVYSMPGAVTALPAVIATRAAGGGYPASVGAGFLAGVGSTYLVHAIRAGRLSAEVLDGILNSRKWPGKLTPPIGDFPKDAGGTEGVAGPEPSLPSGPKTAPQLPVAPTTPEGPTAQAATMPSGAGDISNEAKATQVARESRAEPQVTKVAEGAVGREPGKRAGTTRETVAGRRTKARERVAAVRAAGGSTELGGGTQEVSGGDAAIKAQEAKEAQQRIMNPDVNVSEMSVHELEQRMQAASPEEFKQMLRFKSEQQLGFDEWKSALEYEYVSHLEEQFRHPKK